VVLDHILHICPVKVSAIEFGERIHSGLFFSVEVGWQSDAFSARDRRQFAVSFRVTVHHLLPKLLDLIVGSVTLRQFTQFDFGHSALGSNMMFWAPVT
jgi:hypothetical protein